MNFKLISQKKELSISYMTSRESLNQLAKLQPDHPIKHGLLKVTWGLGLGAASFASGFMAIDMKDGVSISSGAMFAVGLFLGTVLGAVSVSSLGGCLYFLGDGLTSLGKSFGKHAKDYHIYYRNGGFTANPSWTDKKFGRMVEPIDTLEKLKDFAHKDYILLNNIKVASINIKSEAKKRFILLAGTIPIFTSYNEYTIELSCEFKKNPIRVYKVTEDEGLVSTLKNLHNGSNLYVLGKYNNESGIELKKFGDAFKEEE